MKKVYDSHMELSKKVVSGVNKLADNVASTMGPKGRNVILQQAGRRPIVTKDGVTVARFVDLEDPVENAAAQIIKQAAEETNTLAGDGTTTSTVLARAILVESQKYLASGVSPVELKRGMEKACKLVVEKLKEDATEVKSLDDLRHVATISANNDPKIGNLIAEAIDLVGKDGAISVKEGRQNETTLETVEGFRIKGGLAAGVFATDERSGALKYDNPLILVTDEKLDAIAPLMPTLELAARESRPLLIVAEEVTGEALAALVTNAVRGTLKVAAVKAPAYGNERRNILKDLATSVGATFVSAEIGKTVEEVQLADLGSAEFVEANKLTTTIMGGECDPDLLDSQIERLKAELEITEDLDECEKIQERITRLASGIAVIHVGGSTEVEMLEAKHRIEDALEAVKSAQDEGIVPGGGVALLQSLREKDSLKEKVDDWNHPEQKVGFDIVMNSLSAPLRQMAVNAGISGDIAVDRVLKSNLGLNLYDESEVDMMEAGIIDPVKVTRTALQNAVSVAGTLITTNHAIIEVDK